MSTRWYRSPELVLHSPHYNEKVDVFALGCNMAELLIGSPLFPGKSELDQLQTIISVMGAPKQTEWPEGYSLAQKLKLTIPQQHGTYESGRLQQHFLQHHRTNVSDQALSLLEEMLHFDPQKRISAASALKHPYLMTARQS